MDNSLKRKIWTGEKESIKKLDQVISAHQTQKQAALNAGENYTAWEIETQIRKFKNLKKLALNTLRSLTK